MRTAAIPRRTFLKGLGTAMALPWLESLAPAAPAGRQPPLRVAFLYVPNGVNMADWTPTTTGAGYALPRILEPLAPLRSHFQILSGLALRTAYGNGDGPGDHARASASFLTGVQARKTPAQDVRAGVSVDQVAAAHLGRETRLPSIELGCDKGQQAGVCDSGYSCAYQFNLAWKTPNTPLPPEVDPRLVFERLFSNGRPGETAEARVRRQAARRSILDFVLEDARRLDQRLGGRDRERLDEYMTSVRDVEQRIEQAERLAVADPGYPAPAGVPRDYGQHLRILLDLLALAFQTDTTRVATFMIAHDGSNRSYPAIGVPDGHHDISHHGGNAEKKEKIARINRFHIQHFAHLLERLQSVREGEGSVLDNCMIVYGSGIADGNAHSHHDLPVLLAGRGGGAFQPGRHIAFSQHTPLANLYLTLLERAGASQPRFGDSTGVLKGLG